MNTTLRIGGFVLGLAVLVLLVLRSGPLELWHSLSHAIWVVGPLVVLWGCVYACNARAWQLLIPARPPRFTFWRAYLISIGTFALNYATPVFSLGGEPVKISSAAALLGQRRAVGSVVGFRFLHAISHVLVFLSAIIPAAILLPHTPLVFVLLALTTAVLIVAAVLLLSQHRAGIFERGVALLSRIWILRRIAARLERHRDALQEFDREMTAVHAAPGRFRKALLTELAGRVLCTMEYAIIFEALGLGFDVPRAFVVANLTSLITNLLFFMPFEVGSKEGGAFLAFAWLGLDPTLGTSAALLSRLREFCWMAIGLIALLIAD